jgi:hypothetical protein
MWTIRAGDRGLPIINEHEYVNDDPEQSIRKINISRYVSGRLVVEILCNNNSIGLEMSQIFNPLVKKIALDRLYSLVSLERIIFSQEATTELRGLLDTLASKYSVPKEIIEDINKQITKMSSGYSPRFGEQEKNIKKEAKEEVASASVIADVSSHPAKESSCP